MRILLLANASSPVLRSWVKLGINNELFLVSIRDRGSQVPSNVNSLTIKSKFGTIFSYFKLFLKLPKIIKHFKPDLILSHYAITNGFIAHLNRFKPHVISVYGSDVYQSKAYFKPIISLVLKGVNKIIVSSEAARNYLLAKYKIEEEKIIVQSWGIEENIFNTKRKESRTFSTELLEEFNIDKSDKFIFSSRCINKIYNQHIVVKAFGEFAKLHPEFRLLMLYCFRYDREYLERIHKIANENGVEDKIIWITRGLTAKEMSVLFSLSDVFITVPKSDQLASTLLEGIACGCIPIVSNLPAYKQVVDDKVNGIFTDSNSEGIYDSLSYFLEKEELLKVNALINANEIRRNFSDSQFIMKIEKEFKKLV